MSRIDILKNYSEKEEDSLYKLKPYLLNGIPYSLPTNASPQLRTYIAAAILAYTNSDGDSWEYEEVLASLDIAEYGDGKALGQFDLLQDSVVKQSMMYTDLISKIQNEVNDVHVGIGNFFMVMGRLKSSFQSAVILLRNGFFIEVSTIYRLIFEQLCWALYVVDEDDFEQIKGKSVTKTVRCMEKVNPEYKKLYSLYSREAHIDPKNISDYLNQSAHGIDVMGRSGKRCNAKTVDLILLMKIYSEVMAYSVKMCLQLSDELREEVLEIVNVTLQMNKLLSECFANEDSGKFNYTMRY